MRPGAYPAFLRVSDNPEVSSSSLHNTLEQQALLKQEQDLQRALAVVRYKLNAMTPIGKLPAEIMSEIFRWITATPDGLPYPSMYTSALCYTWVTLLYVCRRWHEVAIATPDLWSLIVATGGHKGIDVCLTRSKNAPLDVVTDPVSLNYPPPLQPKMLPALQNIFHHARRIRTIDLSLHHTNHLEVMDGLPKVHMPRLRYLTIAVATSASLNHIQRPSSFPFGSLNCPDIRELSITRCDFPLENIIDYTKLTSLTINFSDYTAIKAPSEMLMLDILRATPDLVTLHLLNVFLPGGLATVDSGAEDPAITKGHTVTLPRLSRVELGGNAAAIASILRHVHFPAPARLSLPLINSRSPADIEAIIGPLQARLDGSAALGPPVHLQSMHILAGTRTHITVDCWVKSSHDITLCPQASLPRQEKPNFKICYPIDALDLGAPYMMPLHNVQSLWLTSKRAYLPPLSFTGVYKSFKSVVELRLRHIHPDIIVKMLDVAEAQKASNPQDESAGKTSVQIADSNLGIGVVLGGSIPLVPADFNFPSLQSLYLSNIEFRHYRRAYHHSYDDDDPTSPTRDLREVLQKRKGAGLDFPHLVFTDCYNLKKAAVKEVRLMGCQVEWDGSCTAEEDQYASTNSVVSDGSEEFNYCEYGEDYQDEFGGGIDPDGYHTPHEDGFGYW